MSKAVNVVIGAVAGFFTGGPVGAVVGAAGALVATQAQEKRERAQQQALDEQRKQVAINNAQQEIARARAIRQSIAEARVRRAQIESNAFGGGPVGAGQAITGDTGTAIGAAQTQAGAATAIAGSQNRQATFQNQANSLNQFDTFAAFANLVGTGVTLYNQGAFEGITDASTFSDIGGGAASGGR